MLLWDGRLARPKRTGGTPIPQTCGTYLILIPKCKHLDKDSPNGEKFVCINCGHIDDANLQAARNVKVKAIEAYGLNIFNKIKSKMVRGDSEKPVQLSLFEMELYEGLSHNTLPPKGSPACGLFPHRIFNCLSGILRAKYLNNPIPDRGGSVNFIHETELTDTQI